MDKNKFEDKPQEYTFNGDELSTTWKAEFKEQSTWDVTKVLLVTIALRVHGMRVKIKQGEPIRMWTTRKNGVARRVLNELKRKKLLEEL